MSKPSRTYTKRRSDAIRAYCGVISVVALILYPDSSATETVIQLAFLSATATLGIYQGVGHLDMRASKKSIFDET